MEPSGSTAPRLVLLGSGNAFNENGRGSQSIRIDSAGGGFLVDCGPTALAALKRLDSATEDLDRLFVTHLHGDHIAGWPFLLLQLTHGDRRTRPFEVWGPAGIRHAFESLATICYGGLLDPPGRRFELEYRELEVGEARAIDTGGGRVDVLPMDHHDSSIGYRFDVDGWPLAISGDTRWCENLERLSIGSDVLVCECTSVGPVAGAHVCLSDLRRNIGRIRSERVVLVHLNDEIATSLAADPLPRTVAGYDGLVVTRDV